MSQLIKRCPEKVGKRLIGRADMEDALKRLDKLTQEEARMATAEVLKSTRAIDKRVLAVDDRVASVDDKVAEVINGAQIVFSQARKILNLNLFRRKGSKKNHQTNC
jgi:hypothetical protein